MLSVSGNTGSDECSWYFSLGAFVSPASHSQARFQISGLRLSQLTEDTAREICLACSTGVKVSVCQGLQVFADVWLLGECEGAV